MVFLDLKKGPHYTTLEPLSLPARSERNVAIIPMYATNPYKILDKQ